MEEKNPFNVFLKQKYSFCAQKGSVKIEKKSRNVSREYAFPEDFPEKMKKACTELYNLRANLQNNIADYQSTNIKLTGIQEDNVTYWEDGQGIPLKELVEMPLKSITEHEYEDIESLYKEIQTSIRNKDYNIEADLKQLVVRYRKAVENSENDIQKNLKRIQNFVSTFGLPYIDSKRRIEKKIGEQIDADLEALFQQESDDEKNKIKIFSVVDFYDQLMTVQHFTVIHNSFCLLCNMHASLEKQNDIEPNELFRNRINLFLQYLTWSDFFIGDMENKDLCSSFACLNDIYATYIYEGQLMSNQGKDVKEFLNNIEDIVKIIGRHFVGDGSEGDNKILKDLKKITYIQLPMGCPNYDYVQLKKRFSNLENVLHFICNETILRYNQYGFYEVEKFEDAVLDGQTVKNSVIGNVNPSLCEVMGMILQDIVTGIFLQLRNILRLNIREKKLDFIFRPRLINALQIEFVFDVIAGITFAKCKNCGKFFIPSKRNKLGCCEHKCTDAYRKRINRASTKPYRPHKK